MQAIIDLISGLLNNYEPILTLIVQFIGWIAVGLSVLIRFRPKQKHENLLGKIIYYMDKAAQYFPTLGINPKTKELMEWAEANKENFPQLKKLL